MIPTVDNKVEKFDIEKFKKNALRGTFLINMKNITIKQDEQKPGYLEELYSNNAVFMLNKFFFDNGNIEKKGYMFNKGSQIGIWYYFDESGKLIKEENKDEGYDFKPEDVVKYCENHKIKLTKGYHESGFQSSIVKEERQGRKVWVIKYQDPTKQTYDNYSKDGYEIEVALHETIILDGKTGKLLFKKEQAPVSEN